MNEFWDFQNAAGDDNAELYIYGDIVAEARYGPILWMRLNFRANCKI